MYGKMWRTAAGLNIEISNMEEQHLCNAATFTYRSFREAHENNKFSFIQRLYNLVQELEYREVDYDDYDAPNLEAIRDLARKYQVALIHDSPTGGVTILTPKDSPLKAYDSTTKENFPPRKTSKEIAEENWQKVEQRMLPEGDRDKITAEKYCFVDNITRRLIIGNINENLPVLYDSKRNRDCKKVRITIEVLED